jgi:hypothetical protein
VFVCAEGAVLVGFVLMLGSARSVRFGFVCVCVVIEFLDNYQTTLPANYAEVERMAPTHEGHNRTSADNHEVVIWSS